MSIQEYRDTICKVTEQFCKENSISNIECNFSMKSRLILLSNRNEYKCDQFKIMLE